MPALSHSKTVPSIHALDSPKQAQLRPQAVRDHRRSLRSDHRGPVVRAGCALEGEARVARGGSHRRARARSGGRHRRHCVCGRGARREDDRARHHASHAAAGAGEGDRSLPAAWRVGFITGDMTSLPFRSASFDLVTTGYGLRNVPDLDARDRRDRARVETRRTIAVARFQPARERDRPRGLSRLSHGRGLDARAGSCIAIRTPIATSPRRSAATLARAAWPSAWPRADSIA